MRWDSTKQRWCSLAAQAALLLGLAGAVQADPITDMSLRAAINDGRTDEAIRLVERGADLNGRTSGGYTPLMIAAGVGDFEMVTFLLARGADPNLENDYGWTAAYIAGINNFKPLQKMIEAASTGQIPGGRPEQAGPGPAVDVPPQVAPQPQAANNRGTAPGQNLPNTAAGRDSHGWPKLGAYAPGQAVIYSGTAGKTWLPGTVKSVDPTFGYNFEGVTGSTDAYFVVSSQREPFWTTWFVGDWNVSVPMAMNLSAQGGDLYRVVGGGMRLPPLRLQADGTYTWRWWSNGGESLIQGRWQPNPEGPGVILKSAAHGADWLMYNNSRTGSSLGHTVILSSEAHTYLDGSRLK